MLTVPEAARRAEAGDLRLAVAEAFTAALTCVAAAIGLDRALPQMRSDRRAQVGQVELLRGV